MPSRPTQSPLDPYGIYGTRTANRLRASRRRRKTQKFLLAVGFLAVAVLAVLFAQWRREDSHFALAGFETGVHVNSAPILVRLPAGGDSLLIAGREGKMLRFDVDANNPNPQKQVLLQADFPLHTPLARGDKVFVPCEDGVLTALSWQSGKQLWRRRFDDSLSAQPTAFDLWQEAEKRKAIVVAGSDSGLVMAIEIGSGKILWRVRLPAPVGNGLSSVESNGRARVLVPLLGGSAMRGGVWCLDGATGKILWRFPAAGREEAVQFAAPVPDLAGNRVFFANDLGAIFALSLTEGKYDSQQSLGWKTVLQPQEHKDETQMVVLRATPLLMDSTSNFNEQFDIESRPKNTLVVGGNDGIVRYLSTRDGIVRWQFATQRPILALLQIRISNGQNLILVVNRSPEFLLLDAKTGKAVQRFSSAGENFAGVTVSGPQIFAVTESGTVHQFTLSQ